MSTEAPKLTKEDFARDVLIQDEAELAKISDAVQIDKMITTPIIEENHFLDEKLIDDISGNDYKEVVNQNAREWILKTSTAPATGNAQAILTVDDALKEVEKEKEKSKETKAQIVEMVAAGRKRRKKKNKKKKEIAENGKLHEVKSLVNKKKKAQNKYDAKAKDIKNIKPIDFLKSKENYQKLKEQVSQGIYDELTKLQGNFNSSIAQALIKNSSR